MVLSSIVESINKISTLNEQIAIASNEQTTGLNQLGKAMNLLDLTVQDNAAAADNIASSANEMLSQSSNMNGTVVEINTLISGRKVA
ncbi:MAG: hypothetical protein R2827_15730 [Bdellovibrionales bacterium]